MIRSIITRSIVTTCRYYSSLVDVSPGAKLDAMGLTVKESFISPSEQNYLMEEIELAMRRVKYSYDHWDDVSIYTV